MVARSEGRGQGLGRGGSAWPSAAPASSTRRRGAQAEQRVSQYLQRAGLHLLATNVLYKVGEIDLVMTDGPTWVFVEVRSRRSAAFGGAAASVDGRKQMRLRRAAQCLLIERFGRGQWPPCRFDVVAIEAGQLQWIKDAF
ncbi:MAG: YraN family protein [Lautropia sp.]|nr:YraN family protein [Lautropia sp.]